MTLSRTTGNLLHRDALRAARVKGLWTRTTYYPLHVSTARDVLCGLAVLIAQSIIYALLLK